MTSSNIDRRKIPYQLPQPRDGRRHRCQRRSTWTATSRSGSPNSEDVEFKPLILIVSAGYYGNLLRVRASDVLSRHRQCEPIWPRASPPLHGPSRRGPLALASHTREHPAVCVTPAGLDAGNPRRMTNAQVVASFDCMNTPPEGVAPGRVRNGSTQHATARGGHRDTRTPGRPCVRLSGGPAAMARVRADMRVQAPDRRSAPTSRDALDGHGSRRSIPVPLH